jgi:hypothetical protein
MPCTRQTAIRIAAAAVIVFEAKIANHSAPAGRLADHDPSWPIRRTKTAAAIPASGANHPIDPGAIRSCNRGQCACSEGCPAGNLASTRAAVTTAGANVPHLNAIRGGQSTLTRFAKLRATFGIELTSVPCSLAGRVECCASSAVALLTATIRIVQTELSVGNALRATLPSNTRSAAAVDRGRAHGAICGTRVDGRFTGVRTAIAMR